MKILDLIQKLEELEKKATPGPWNDFKSALDGGGTYISLCLSETHPEHGTKQMTYSDHDLAIQARNAIPNVLQCLKEAVDLVEQGDPRTIDVEDFKNRWGVE